MFFLFFFVCAFGLSLAESACKVTKKKLYMCVFSKVFDFFAQNAVGPCCLIDAARAGMGTCPLVPARRCVCRLRLCSGLAFGQPFQSPCRLQYSRALTALASVLNSATGLSPGLRYFLMVSVSVQSSIHSM